MKHSSIFATALVFSFSSLSLSSDTSLVTDKRNHHGCVTTGPSVVQFEVNGDLFVKSCFRTLGGGTAASRKNFDAFSIKYYIERPPIDQKFLDSLKAVGIGDGTVKGAVRKVERMRDSVEIKASESKRNDLLYIASVLRGDTLYPVPAIQQPTSSGGEWPNPRGGTN